VGHTELTDKPCPKCGASLDLMVTPPHGVPAFTSKPPPERETVELTRSLVCPDCGWIQPENSG
jgi:hypothetical protein